MSNYVIRDGSSAVLDINALPLKASPIGTDEIVIADSVDGFILKKSPFSSTSEVLTPAQQAAVDSIVVANPDELLVSSGGNTDGVLLSKNINVSDGDAGDIFTGDRTLTTNVTGLKIAEAYKISSSISNLTIEEKNSGRFYSPVLQENNVEGNSAFVQFTTAQPQEHISTNAVPLTNPTWSYTPVQDFELRIIRVTFDAAITNVFLEVKIAGVTFYKENVGDYTAIITNINLDRSIVALAGQVLDFSIYSPDGDVILLGVLGTGIPEQRLNYSYITDTPVVIDTDINLKLARSVQNTGIIEGGILTVISPTSITISAGSGRVTNLSDPENPIVSEVSWVVTPSYTSPSSGTDGTYLVSYDSAGLLTELPLETLDNIQLRDHIILGALSYFGGVIVNFDANPFNIGYDGAQSFQDFFRDIIGPSTISGCIFSANGVNLSVDLLGGNIYILGCNFRNSPKNPDERVIASVSAAGFLRVFRDGLIPADIIPDGAGTIFVDPTMWDDGSGTLQSVAANDFTVQVIYLTPSGQTVIAFGQEIFNTLASARDAVNDGALQYMEVVTATQLVLRSYLVVKGNTVDLSDPTEAEFITAGKFRLSGVTSGGSIGGITSPAGPDGAVQFNDLGAFGGQSNLIYDKNTSILTIDNAVTEHYLGTNVYPAATSQVLIASDSSNGIQLFTSNNATSTIFFGDTDVANAANIRYLHNVDSFEFIIGGSKKFDINSNVEVLTPLVVSGNIIANNAFNLIQMERESANIFIGETRPAGGDWGFRNTSVGANDTGLNLNNLVTEHCYFGSDSATLVTSGHSAIVIGAQSAVLATALDDTVLLGNDLVPTLLTADNVIMIGVGIDAPNTTPTDYMSVGDAIFADLATKKVRIGGSGLVTGDAELKVTGEVEADSFNELLLQSSGTAEPSIFIGATVLTPPDGQNDIGIGNFANSLSGSGGNNISIGRASLGSSQTGIDNICIGANSAASQLAPNSAIAIGHNSQTSLVLGTKNISIGHASMSIGLGASACAQNIGIGDSTLEHLSQGNNNIAIGFLSGQAMTNGVSNILIGLKSGLIITTGSNNILIGDENDIINPTDSNSIVIGNSLTNSDQLTSDSLNIGDTIWGDLSNQSIRIGGTVSTPFNSEASLDLLDSDRYLITNRMSNATEGAATFVNGAMWYNTDANEFRGYQNGAIVSFDTTAV